MQWYGTCNYVRSLKGRASRGRVGILEGSCQTATALLPCLADGALNGRSGSRSAPRPTTRTLALGRLLGPWPDPVPSRKTARGSGPWGRLRKWIANCNLGGPYNVAVYKP